MAWNPEYTKEFNALMKKWDDEIAIKQYDYSNVELQAKYEAVSEMLKNTDVNNLTPIEAITKLAELKQKYGMA